MICFQGHIFIRYKKFFAKIEIKIFYAILLCKSPIFAHYLPVFCKKIATMPAFLLYNTTPENFCQRFFGTFIERKNTRAIYARKKAGVFYPTEKDGRFTRQTCLFYLFI